MGAFFDRMSIGDKPRRQSFAIGQNKEQVRPPKISEEIPEAPVRQEKPVSNSSSRKSFSLWGRRSSVQQSTDRESVPDGRCRHPFYPTCRIWICQNFLPLLLLVWMTFFGPLHYQ